MSLQLNIEPAQQKPPESGATLVEYGLIAAGVVVAITAAIFCFGPDLSSLTRGTPPAAPVEVEKAAP